MQTRDNSYYRNADYNRFRTAGRGLIDLCTKTQVDECSEKPGQDIEHRPDFGTMSPAIKDSRPCSAV
jgi:hypothetical protein